MIKEIRNKMRKKREGVWETGREKERESERESEKKGMKWKYVCTKRKVCMCIYC